MLQVKTFIVPAEEAEANAFLETHKPSEGGINFNQDRITIFYDDGRGADLYKVAIVREMLDAAKAAMFQQEIALAVTKDERDNRGAIASNRHQQLTMQVNDLEDGIKNQKAKIAFLETRLADYEKAGK